MTLRAVDVQGFAGAFTLAVVQAGFELKGKREMIGGFGVPNCEANRHLLTGDWLSQACDPAEWQPEDVELVFGNPPCSGFSVASDHKSATTSWKTGEDSDINQCMWALVEYAARCQPHTVIFESVQNAFWKGRNLMNRLRDRLEELTGWQYTLHHVLHNATHLGGPAIRPRYFWVASAVPFGIEQPDYRQPMIQDVIGDLEGLPETMEPQYYNEGPTWWSAERRTPWGYVDGHVHKSSPMVRRQQELMQYEPWPPGMKMLQVLRNMYERTGAVPPSWEGMARTNGVIADHYKHRRDPFRRWNYDKPGRVMTGCAFEEVIHPVLPRPITYREGARIMGFPDTWLIKPIADVLAPSKMAMTWGKGITVDCGRWIAEWAERAIHGNPGTYAGELIGDREYFIDVTKGAINKDLAKVPALAQAAPVQEDAVA